MEIKDIRHALSGLQFYQDSETQYDLKVGKVNVHIVVGSKHSICDIKIEQKCTHTIELLHDHDIITNLCKIRFSVSKIADGINDLPKSNIVK